MRFSHFIYGVCICISRHCAHYMKFWRPGTSVPWLTHSSWNSKMQSLLNSFIHCHLLVYLKSPPGMKNDMEEALNKSTIFVLFVSHGNPMFVHYFDWKFLKFLSELGRLHDPSAHKFKWLHTFIKPTCINQQVLFTSWTVDFWEIEDFILQLWFYEPLHFTLSLGWGLETLSSLLNPIGSMPSVLISIKNYSRDGSLIEWWSQVKC